MVDDAIPREKYYYYHHSRTVDLCQKVEKAGVSWLTVHARTADQRCEPINMDALRVIKDSVSVPVVGNGDICSVHDAEQVHQNTNVNGMSCIMSTRRVPV